MKTEKNSEKMWLCWYIFWNWSF